MSVRDTDRGVGGMRSSPLVSPPETLEDYDSTTTDDQDFRPESQTSHECSEKYGTGSRAVSLVARGDRLLSVQQLPAALLNASLSSAGTA